jgi:hypothetical protein
VPTWGASLSAAATGKTSLLDVYGTFDETRRPRRRVTSPR